MKKYVTIFCLLIASQGFSQTSSCDKCNLRYIKIINDNYKNLTIEMVEKFLCSLDYNCNLNLNYILAANKTIYSILEYKPEYIVNCLQRYNYLNQKYILEHISNPPKSRNFSLAYKKTKAIDDSSTIKNKIVVGIKRAAFKYNIKL